MHKVKIKTLSVNCAWRGRRFKTPAYLNYETELFYLLPDIKVPEDELRLEMTVGFSNKLADLDNIAKPIIDIFQKKYNFNDRCIFELFLKKIIVKKGKEFLQFKFSKI